MDLGTEMLLFNATLLGGASIPPWVLAGAVIDMDFANGRYFGGTLASLLSTTRASSKTDLLPASASGFAYSTFPNNVLAITPASGALIEEVRTNALLNSTAPVTQTTASLATGTYTLWVNGSGSATSSAGSATITGGGAATNGTPNTFVVTVAGTVTITVSGSLNAFQCELGAFGTSLIVTAGATATRTNDDVRFAGAALSLLQTSIFSAVVADGGVKMLNGALLAGNVDSSALIGLSSSQIRSVQSAVTLSAALGSGATTGATKNGVSFNASGRSIVANSGTVATDANTLAGGNTGFNLGNRPALTGPCNAYFSRASFWNTRLADAALKALTA